MRLLPDSYCWTKLFSQREVRWKEGVGESVWGDHSHLSEQLSKFSVLTCSLSGAAYTTDPLSAFSFPQHDGFYWSFALLTQEVIFSTTTALLLYVSSKSVKHSEWICRMHSVENNITSQWYFILNYNKERLNWCYCNTDIPFLIKLGDNLQELYWDGCWRN